MCWRYVSLYPFGLLYGTPNRNSNLGTRSALLPVMLEQEPASTLDQCRCLCCLSTHHCGVGKVHSITAAPSISSRPCSSAIEDMTTLEEAVTDPGNTRLGQKLHPVTPWLVACGSWLVVVVTMVQAE
jgi:hypothetical protein